MQSHEDPVQPKKKLLKKKILSSFPLLGPSLLPAPGTWTPDHTVSRSPTSSVPTSDFRKSSEGKSRDQQFGDLLVVHVSTRSQQMEPAASGSPKAR